MRQFEDSLYEDRLKEVRDADPVGHEARLKQSQGQFMDKKVTSQQIDGHTNSIRFSHAVMWPTPDLAQAAPPPAPHIIQLWSFLSNAHYRPVHS